MNGYLQVAKKIWGCLKDMKEKWNAKKKKGKRLLVVKFVQVQERKKLCNIICPYRETAVATIPAIDFNPRENENKLNRFPFLK